MVRVLLAVDWEDSVRGSTMSRPDLEPPPPPPPPPISSACHEKGNDALNRAHLDANWRQVNVLGQVCEMAYVVAS